MSANRDTVFSKLLFFLIMQFTNYINYCIIVLISVIPKRGSIMRKFILSTAITLLSSAANAATLEEALKSSYNHNEELKIIRTEFLNEIEAFPKALSEFMPRVVASFESADTKFKGVNGAKIKDTHESNSIALEQPIFNGGSSVAGLTAAQSAFRLARSNYYSKEQKVFLDEINTYLSYAEATEKLGIAKISIKSNKKQLEAAKEKFKLGEATETDVAWARAGLANAEANFASAEAGVEAAKANFFRVFGIEATTNIKMPDSSSVNLPKTLEELTEKATTLNLEVDAAKHATKYHKSMEHVAQGRLLPEVKFKVQASKDRHDSADYSNKNGESVSSVISVTVPILAKGGAEYSAVRSAKHETRKSVMQLDLQMKKIRSEAKSLWEIFAATKSKIEAMNQAVKAAEKAYEGMIQEEALGSKTIVDVLSAEERLSKEREKRVDARKELLIVSYRIKSLTADLTAKAMKLPVEHFDPEQEFKKVKTKIIGF